MTRAAGREFLRTAFGKSADAIHAVAPLASVPADYADQLRGLRTQLHLTQAALAQRIGAAGKAVIYQCESGKRTPSPVFWAKIEHVHSTYASERFDR